MTTGAGVFIASPEKITDLESKIPGFAWLAVQDWAGSLRLDLMRNSPEGYVYVTAAKRRELAEAKAKEKGKTIKSRIKTAKWLKSGAVKGKSNLKGSWQVETFPQQMAVDIFTSVPYAGVLEMGLYPNPPTTRPPSGRPPAGEWRVSGGFSKGAPGGLIQPVINDETIMNNAMDLIVDEVAKLIGVNV